MTEELKTLKEIVTSEKYNQDNCGYSWNIHSVEKELRKEAIKWIKKLKYNIKRTELIMPITEKQISEFYDSYLFVSQIAWIKMFFNLTEKDLEEI